MPSSATVKRIEITAEMEISTVFHTQHSPQEGRVIKVFGRNIRPLLASLPALFYIPQLLSDRHRKLPEHYMAPTQLETFEQPPLTVACTTSDSPGPG